MASRGWRKSLWAGLLVCGCANWNDTSAPPDTYRVQGKVLQATGEPVTSGTIRFHAKDKPGNDAMARITKEGSFKLGTFSKEDGAIPGRYAVTIEPNKTPKSNPHVSIPKKYWNEEATPLSVEVKAADNVLPPFRLR